MPNENKPKYKNQKNFVIIKWSRAADAVSYLRRGGDETRYDHRHVNAIFGMLKSVYGDGFRLTCITDNPAGFERDIRVFAMRDEHRSFVKEIGGRFFKLFLYSREFGDFIGDDFIYLDLDVAITGDIWYHGTADLAILEGRRAATKGQVTLRQSVRQGLSHLRKGRMGKAFAALKSRRVLWCKFNSSFVFVRAHKAHDLWENFDKHEAEKILSQNDVVGTDQAWLRFNDDNRFVSVNWSEGYFKFSDLRGRRREIENNRLDIRFVAFPGDPASKPWAAGFQDAIGVSKIYLSHFDEAAAETGQDTLA